MERINPKAIFAFQLLLMLAIPADMFFIGIDVFGFRVGVYGISVAYPLNLILSVLLIMVFVLVGIAVHQIISKTNKSDISSITISLLIGWGIYTLFIDSDYIVTVIWVATIFIIITAKSYLIERKENQSAQVLQFDMWHLAILMGLAGMVTVVNYGLWFLSSREELKDPIHGQFFSILTHSDEYQISQMTPKYIEPGEYYNFFYQGVSISIIAVAILLIAFASLVWRRSQTLIAIVEMKPDVWYVKKESSDYEITLEKIDDQQSLHSFVANGLQYLELKYDKFGYLNALENLYGVVRRRLLEPVEDKQVYVSNQFSVNLDYTLQKMGNELSKVFNRQDLLRVRRISKPIVLIPPTFRELNIENIFFKINDDQFDSLYTHLNFINLINEPGLPLAIRRNKRILHLGSSDFNSSILQLHLKKILFQTSHELEFVKLGIDETKLLPDILKKEWDIILISLHGSIDGDGHPFFHFNDHDGIMRYIYPEDFQQKYSFSIAPSIVMLPTCLTMIADEDVLDFADVFIQGGSSIVLASLIPVLSSHMSLVSLPFFENLLDCDFITLFDVHNAMRASYLTVRKFGFLSHWGFFRFFVRHEIKGIE